MSLDCELGDDWVESCWAHHPALGEPFAVPLRYRLYLGPNANETTACAVVSCN